MSSFDRLAKQLVNASLDFMRRKPWKLVAPDAFFLIAVPTERFPLAAAISGRGGVERGISLSRGIDGLARFMRVVHMEGLDGHAHPLVQERWDHINLGFEPLGDIPRELRGFLKRGGFRGRREKLAPCVHGKRPHEGCHPPTRQEMRTLLWCLGAVSQVLDAGLLQLKPTERGREVLRLVVTGSPVQPDVRLEAVAWEKALGGADLLRDLTLPGDEVHGRSMAKDGVPVEDPVTLAEWKRADLHFIKGMTSGLLDSGTADSPRALRRYFGHERTAEKVLRDLQNMGPRGAYLEWLAADYRATYRSKTWLEKLLLRKTTPSVHRTIAQARCMAEHSIYRVDASDPGSTLEVEDVLSGRCFLVHDSLLSSSGLEGLFVPLRLMKLGEWTFPTPAGPPLTAFQVDGALRHLDALGLPPTATSLRTYAVLIGRLFGWCLDSHRRRPELRNMDGDPLLWHSTSFKVAKPEALVAALDGRADVTCDEEGSGWAWLRQGGGVAGFGQDLSLCRLELLGDELRVEANSARRMVRAREWVDGLPGLSLLSESTTEVGKARESRPLDDRLPELPPESTPPEVIEEVRRLIDKQHRGWLDVSVSALGGQTPRQACADPGGRRLVERLIRTMPASSYPGGLLQPPRKELLDELGLGADSSS